MTNTTDTPRTIEILISCPSHLQEVALANLSQDLERELAASKAEVERLTKMVIEAAELGDKRSENFKARAEKAEASLIKINEELCQAGLREYGV
jgi:hypothetical protein